MTMVNKPCHILPWMQQLSDAVACLESVGYAHGDINPRNVLLDDEDQLKLVDFDHARKIGEDLEVGYEPYVRFHRRGTTCGGTYGIAGPVTEQFALGSVVLVHHPRN
jgi:serine/threonine protein kinase